MADTKISALTAATTPLAGTEVLPIVQSGVTKQVSVANLTAGRDVSVNTLTSTVATGTAPFTVSSTTQVTNLNAATAGTASNLKSNATTGVMQIVGPAAASTRVMTIPDANFTAARTDAAQTFTGDQTLGTGNLIINTAAKGITTSGAQALWFGINNGTGNAQVNASGYFKASNNGTFSNSTGTFHEFYKSVDGNALVIRNVASDLSTGGVVEIDADRNTTNNTFYALSYYNYGASAYKFRVADSGNVTNTNGSYGTISDVKMKTDIVDASSQWNDIKSIRFRKFKMKDDPQQVVQLGVIAQELEQTSPGLVENHIDRDREGNDLGTTTKSVKTSVLLMKAAVALQEAIKRIEQLETKVVALESK